MPVYNQGEYLEKAVKSILNQTHKNFELIISDNNSLDATIKIIHKLKKIDSRIVFFAQDQNYGSEYNFNFVRSKASGEYFMWAAGDDMWDPNWIKVLLAECVKTQDFVFGKVLHIDLQDRIIKKGYFGIKSDYKGLTLKKRIKFYLTPGLNGKANLIYSLGPTKKFKKMSFNNAKNFTSDIGYLFSLLEDNAIRVSDLVILYKRENQLQSNFNRRIKLTYLISLLVNGFIPIYFKTYWTLATKFEKILILILYPYAVILNLTIYLKITKK